MAIKAIIGLGNEGKEYEKTYHSVGFFGCEFLRNLAERENGPRVKFLIPKGYFMNQMGAAAKKFISNTNLKSREILILHDDSDLMIGQFKLVFGGGSAGHKGVEDVINNLKTEDFWRLRIGIRDPGEFLEADLPAGSARRRRKAGEFVLKQWSGADQAQFEEALTRAWEEIKMKLAN